ncbi:MAG: hypothetical protein FWC64_02640 [Treponema sp.]|nr:hypothetical protein [Treponema sp.]
MGNYYKRETSLMDERLYPRTSLDKPIENPDMSNSFGLSPIEKSNQEIIESVVAGLKRIGTVKKGNL